VFIGWWKAAMPRLNRFLFRLWVVLTGIFYLVVCLNTPSGYKPERKEVLFISLGPVVLGVFLLAIGWLMDSFAKYPGDSDKA
jgi:hypothetical protein